MNVDFKVTTWERVSVPDELKDAVLEALNNGRIQTSNDLINFLDDRDSHGEYSIIAEVEEQMTPEENGGQATIEVEGESYDKPLWKNA